MMLMSWSATVPIHAAATDCKSDAAGIILPNGFCATIFADNIGHARQMAVAPDGTLYVNTWSGIYYNNGTVPAGGFVVALRDKDGDGRADVTERFGETVASGAHGGTGLAFYNGMIYAEINDRIVGYPLGQDEIAAKSKGKTIISGLPITGDHPMHPFLITPKGDLLVDGSATNDCEKKNRFPHSQGNDPCTEKATRGGIWRYDANKTDQHFSPAERYASGLRNSEGLSLDAAGRIFATQHGRDHSARTGRSSILHGKVRTCRLKSLSNCDKARITVGPNAISTTSSKSWSSGRSTAATAVRRSVSAPSGKHRSRSFRHIGRPTT
jgi:glucose/arabinose dehydrogenase